jgi:ornithine carbamoyltransferase
MGLPSHLKGRDFLRIADWAAGDLEAVLELAAELKSRRRERPAPGLLPGRSVGLIFEKPSTRTRVSFAVGVAELGATAVPLATGDMQLGRGETIRDTAIVLSRYLDAIVIRTYRQDDVEALARYADVPVVNALTDEFHPCQALADMLTIRERFGSFEGVRVAYIGDGNNVCHSLMAACAGLGAGFTASTPTGYEPHPDAVARAREAALQSGAPLELVRDPRDAARGADVLYTDVWTSMGQDAEQDRRRRDFAGYRIDDELLALAGDRAIVMHDLPAHYGEEIVEEVLHGPRSAAWDQAENRLHTQKALLALIVP